MYLSPKEAFILFIAGCAAFLVLTHAPPAPAQEEPAPSPVSTFNIDVSAAAVGNHNRDGTDLTAGARLGTPLWYSPLAWRLQLGVRTSFQLNASPRLTLHPSLMLEGGLRFLLLSFLSIEGYVGPRIGGQFGDEGRTYYTGVGATAAYLIHPGRDNRQRFRLGMEIFRFVPFLPLIPGPNPSYRHTGFFFGYEVAF